MSFQLTATAVLAAALLIPAVAQSAPDISGCASAVSFMIPWSSCDISLASKNRSWGHPDPGFDFPIMSHVVHSGLT